MPSLKLSASLPLEIGRFKRSKKEAGSFPKQHFSGANCLLVSARVVCYLNNGFVSDHQNFEPMFSTPYSELNLQTGKGCNLEGLSLISFPRLKSSKRTAVSTPERHEIVQWAILDEGLGEFLWSSPPNFHKIDNYLQTLIPSYHRKFSVFWGGSNVYSIYFLKRFGMFFQKFPS